MAQIEWTSLILEKKRIGCFEDFDEAMIEIYSLFIFGSHIDSDN